MKDTSVLEADQSNLLRMAETWSRYRAETIGGKPRPIRGRAFWRAYRRGELWAVVSYKTYEMLMRPSPFLRLLGTAVPDRNCPDGCVYLTYPVTPVIYGKN